MIIQVKQKHIRKGRRFKSRGCPIALALLDAGFKNPSVGVESYYYCDNEFQEKINLSLKCRKFILDFDSEEKVKPFSFIVKKIKQ